MRNGYTLEKVSAAAGRLDEEHSIGWATTCGFAHAVHVDDDEIRQFAAQRGRGGALSLLQHATRSPGSRPSRSIWRQA